MAMTSINQRPATSASAGAARRADEVDDVITLYSTGEDDHDHAADETADELSEHDQNDDDDVSRELRDVVTELEMSQDARDQALVEIAIDYVPQCTEERLRTAQRKYAVRTGHVLSRRRVKEQLTALCTAGADTSSTVYKQMSEPLRELLGEYHAMRRRANEEMLLDVVLEVRPFGDNHDEVVEKWEAVADTYHARLDELDRGERLSGKELRSQVDHLLAVFVDERSVENASLSPRLRVLLEQYNHHKPRGKKRPAETQNTEAQGARRARSGPAAVEVAELEHDASMLRQFFDGCFSIRQSAGRPQALHQSLAASRGPDWSGQRVQERIDWLLDVYGDSDHDAYAALTANKELCDMLEDYNQCVSRMRPYLAIINRKCPDEQSRKSFDDLLLEKTVVLQPFHNADEPAAWRKIAKQLNRLLQAKVLFTGESCSARFRLLRDVHRGHCMSSIVDLSAPQRELLNQISRLMEAPPAPPRAAVPQSQLSGGFDDEIEVLSDHTNDASPASSPRQREVYEDVDVLPDPGTDTSQSQPSRTVEEEIEVPDHGNDASSSPENSPQINFLVPSPVRPRDEDTSSSSDEDELIASSTSDNSVMFPEAKNRTVPAAASLRDDSSGPSIEEVAESEQTEATTTTSTRREVTPAPRRIVHSPPPPRKHEAVPSPDDARNVPQRMQTLAVPQAPRKREPMASQSEARNVSQRRQTVSVPPAPRKREATASQTEEVYSASVRRQTLSASRSQSELRTEAAPTQEPAVTSPREDQETEVLTLLLKATERYRPTQAGSREMFVWDRVRADVNFEMGREVVTNHVDCRRRVNAVLHFYEIPNHPMISTLTTDQMELLRRIKSNTLSAASSQSVNGDFGRSTDISSSHSQSHASFDQQQPTAQRLSGHNPYFTGRVDGRGRGRGRGPHTLSPPIEASANALPPGKLQAHAMSQQDVQSLLSATEERLMRFMAMKMKSTVSEDMLKQYLDVQELKTKATVAILEDKLRAARSDATNLARELAATRDELQAEKSARQRLDDEVKHRFRMAASAFATFGEENTQNVARGMTASVNGSRSGSRLSDTQRRGR